VKFILTLMGSSLHMRIQIQNLAEDIKKDLGRGSWGILLSERDEKLAVA
jgi:hypothetical protein